MYFREKGLGLGRWVCLEICRSLEGGRGAWVFVVVVVEVMVLVGRGGCLELEVG